MIHPTTTMKSNISKLKMPWTTAYGTLFNDTLEEYETNMRERFDNEKKVSEEYIDECREFEVNMIEKTEDDALEAIGKKCNALAVSRMIMGMTKAIMDTNYGERM